MKMFQVLPQGAAAQMNKAAKTQSAQERIKRLAVEIAARKLHWHETLVGSIVQFADARNAVKVLQLIRLYTATYPNSEIKPAIEEMRAWAVEYLKPAKKLSHQALQFVDKLPASWGKA